MKKSILFGITAALGLSAGAVFADGHGSTLDVVKERGNLLCGVSTGSPGFSGVDDSGKNVGFDVDYCRALAAAIFNDPMAVKFVPLSSAVRFTALASGEVDILASSKDSNFNYIPKDYDIPTESDYLHITTNNTIFGTQFSGAPDTDCHVFADMSSDIFSRNIDYSKFSLIYAGAQKNIGPAGTTLVVIKKSLLDNICREVPSMLNYKIHNDKDSMFNTPPVFAVYACMLSMEWLKSNGGISEIEKINRIKAQKIYDEIDRNAMFKGFAAIEDRSIMNVTFNLVDESTKEVFDKMVNDKNISGINGHRSVGGYRASIYNALSVESVETLVNVMNNFEKNI